jgi:hypothetical protein
MVVVVVTDRIFSFNFLLFLLQIICVKKREVDQTKFYLLIHNNKQILLLLLYTKKNNNNNFYL